MPGEREPQACTLVIFGATGDLTRRKLMPGLYSLAREALLPKHFAVVAFARRDKSHEQFRDEMRQAIEEFARYPLDESLWNTFASSIYYHRSTFDDALGYGRLQEFLREGDAIVISHGGSRARGIKNAIRVAREAILADVLGKISNQIREGITANEYAPESL